MRVRLGVYVRGADMNKKQVNYEYSDLAWEDFKEFVVPSVTHESLLEVVPNCFYKELCDGMILIFNIKTETQTSLLTCDYITDLGISLKTVLRQAFKNYHANSVFPFKLMYEHGEIIGGFSIVKCTNVSTALFSLHLLSEMGLMGDTLVIVPCEDVLMFSTRFEAHDEFKETAEKLYQLRPNPLSPNVYRLSQFKNLPRY